MSDLSVLVTEDYLDKDYFLSADTKEDEAEAKAAAEAAKAKAAAAEAEKNALFNKNIALQDEIDRLNASKDVTALQNLRNNPCTLYFELGKATLSEKELSHLKEFVDNVNGAKVKVLLGVAGGTDTKTGSAHRNEVLRQERAEYVYNLLVRDYGFEEENVTVTDGVIDIASPSLSRVAVITCK